jgi:hypothetical protein
MVSSRKRGREQLEEYVEATTVPKEPSLLQKIRNMWEFANLSQWIFIFGRTVKIDENVDIEVRRFMHSSACTLFSSHFMLTSFLLGS